MSKQKPTPSLTEAAGKVAGAIPPVGRGAANAFKTTSSNGAVAGSTSAENLAGAVDRRVSEIQGEHMLTGGAQSGAGSSPGGYPATPELPSAMNEMAKGNPFLAASAHFNDLMLGSSDPYAGAHNRSTPHQMFIPNKK